MFLDIELACSGTSEWCFKNSSEGFRLSCGVNSVFVNNEEDNARGARLEVGNKGDGKLRLGHVDLDMVVML